MGFVRSFFRAVTQAVKSPVVQVAPVQAPVAAAQTAPVDVSAQKKAALGSGYGTSGQTVMAGGDTEEANVSKTVLGGGKKKKVKA
jgi:hypothetical protein|tara:strand:- start:359 stop:613 length:255 start_codon:yes stop_codon:yes gene_type:complete